MERLYTVVGATSRVLEIELRDRTGNVLDHVEYDTAEIGGDQSGVAKIPAGTGCTLTAPTANGIVRYTPSAAHIDTPGDIICRLTLTNGVGDILITEEFVIEVGQARGV